MLRAIARGHPSPIWRRVLKVANPGAGADVTVPVPGQRCWQLLSVAGLFTASGVAGNRFPTLTLRDTDGIPLARIPCPTAITAGLAPVVTWTPGIGAAVVVAATSAALTLPERWYMQSQESLTLTGHTNAGDTWTHLRVVVLETYTGDDMYVDAIEQRIIDHGRALVDLFEGR